MRRVRLGGGRHVRSHNPCRPPHLAEAGDHHVVRSGEGDQGIVDVQHAGGPMSAGTTIGEWAVFSRMAALIGGKAMSIRSKKILHVLAGALAIAAVFSAPQAVAQSPGAGSVLPTG